MAGFVLKEGVLARRLAREPFLIMSGRLVLKKRVIDQS